MVSWDDIPDDAAQLILDKMDVFSKKQCQWVARSWSNIIASLEVQIPHFMMTPHHMPPALFGADAQGNGFRFYELCSEKSYRITVPSLNGTVIGGGEGWLVSGLEPRRNFSLTNPLTRQIISLSRSYTSAGGPEHACDFLRVVICRSPYHANGFFLVGLGYFEAAGVCYLRTGDSRWNLTSPLVAKSSKRRFILEKSDDAILYQGRVYVVSSLGNLYSFDLNENSELVNPKFITVGDDPSDPTRPLQFSLPIMSNYGSHNKHCISHFLVNIEPDYLVMFTREVVYRDRGLLRDKVKAFKCSLAAELPTSWDNINYIGDFTAFLGRTNSVAVPITPSCKCKPNNVYFTNDWIERISVHDLSRQTERHLLQRLPTIPVPVWLKPSFV